MPEARLLNDRSTWIVCRLRNCMYCAVGFGVVATLISCTSAPTSAPPAAATPADGGVTIQAQAAAQSAEVKRLLAKAAAQIDARSLSSPEGDNALETLQTALALEPTQPDTLEAVFRGRERIAEVYLALADKALRRFDQQQARQLLERAAAVDPEHLGLAPLRERLRLAAAAQTRSIALDPRELNLRSSALSSTLLQAGGDAKRANAFVQIRARSDEEGRWIYEQLNKAAGGRLRAEILRAGQPSIATTTTRANTPDRAHTTCETC